VNSNYSTVKPVTLIKTKLQNIKISQPVFDDKLGDSIFLPGSHH
jgi:hypothetical protein